VGSDVKAAARQALDRVQPALIDLSHRIHAHPELKWEEYRAAGWVADSLADANFAVTAPVCDLPTAVSATVGSGPLHVALCAEYDALPDVGHACGHNIIAATAVGAALALADLVDDVGLTVSVIGTPAEEGGGGKIALLERGAFAGVHAAMMTHPFARDIVEWPMIAMDQLLVGYTGKEAHASAFPELGINAADAVTVAQVAIGLLRQHLDGGDRVHGIITCGGHAPNIVPARAEAHYMIRAATLDGLSSLRRRIERCFEAGALATGATLDLATPHPAYAEMHHDAGLAAAYARNAATLGRATPARSEEDRRAAASTDMGNISQVIPSIHPAIGIGSGSVVNHQPEFAAHCATAAADAALFDGALALAWTAIDAATDSGLRDRLIGEARAVRGPAG
jgi:amidohydrolase